MNLIFNTADNATTRLVPIATFMCPSASPEIFNQLVGGVFTPMDVKGNYGPNWGTRTYWDQGNGNGQVKAPFYMMYGARIAAIVDGTSNTLAMPELLQAPSPNGTPQAIDRRARPWHDDSATYQVSSRFAPNTAQPDYGVCVNDLPRRLPCTNDTNSGNAREFYLSARSRHAGGVNGLLCDGSVRFFKDSVSIPVWQAVSTASGGEVISGDQD